MNEVTQKWLIIPIDGLTKKQVKEIQQVVDKIRKDRPLANK